MKYGIAQITERELTNYLSSSITNHKEHNFVPCTNDEDIEYPVVSVNVVRSVNQPPLDGVFEMDINVMVLTQVEISGSLSDNTYLLNEVTDKMGDTLAVRSYCNGVSGSLFIYNTEVKDVGTEQNNKLWTSLLNVTVMAQQGFNPSIQFGT